MVRMARRVVYLGPGRHGWKRRRNLGIAFQRVVEWNVEYQLFVNGFPEPID